MLAPAAGASDPRHQELNSHSTTSLPYLSATHPLSAWLARQQHLWREKTEGFVMPYHIMPGQEYVTTSVFCLYAIVDPLYMQGFILGKCNEMQEKKKGKREREGHLTRFILHWRVARGV